MTRVITVTMGNIKNCKFCLLPMHYKAPPLNPGLIVLVVSIMINLPGIAHSNTEITPSFSIKESLVDTEEDSTSDSGQITTIAPGIKVLREGPRSSLSLDYQLNAVYNHGFDESDDREVHLLKFLTKYQHSPGKWVSSLRARSELTNPDPDGRQNINPDIIDDNSRELRTIVVDTAVTDRITDTIQYRAGLNLDYAEYADTDDADDTEGRGVQLWLDNIRSLNDFTWITQLDSQIVEDDDNEEHVDTFNLKLNYRFTRKWSSFVDYTRTETELLQFEDEARLVGLTWEPSNRSYITLGVGKRDDDDTYSIDAVSERRNVIYSATYTEKILTSRRETLNQQQQAFFALPTTQSISIIPVLQKRATVNITVIGNHSTYEASVFQTNRSDLTFIEPDETVTGLRFSYAYQVSPRDEISANLIGQERETLETQDFVYFQTIYSRFLSKSETMNIAFEWVKEDSDEDTNEYERVLVSAEYRVTF